jgi:hypothetical protein
MICSTQIDELLSYGVNVTVYNGQVILILHLLLSPKMNTGSKT